MKESGKKPEVDLKAGQLLFDVTAPLQSDESLSVRTSTMVTGIRGTMGWVEKLSETVTRLYMLSGSVETHATNPKTGEIKMRQILAGQVATIYIYEADRPGETVDIVIEGFAEGDIPGFVVEYIRQQKPLQDRIGAETRLSVPLILGYTGRLALDQAAAQARSAQAQREADQLDNDRIDPLFVDGGGGGTSPSTIYTSTEIEDESSLATHFSGYTTVFVDGSATGTPWVNSAAT